MIATATRPIRQSWTSIVANGGKSPSTTSAPRTAQQMIETIAVTQSSYVS